jgi:hypothetical protein
MKYIECFGGLWKISEAKYKKLVKQIQRGNDVNLDDFGKQIGTVEGLLCLQEMNRPEKKNN